MKLLLAPIMIALCFCGSLFGIGAEYLQVVEGQLHFVFQPTGAAGTQGAWQPVILTPDGEYFQGPVTAYDSTDRIDLVVSCCGGEYVELGCYGILLKNNITDAVDAPLVSSISVTPTTPTVPFDTVTYKQIAPSSMGENTLIYYVLPSMGSS